MLFPSLIFPIRMQLTIMGYRISSTDPVQNASLASCIGATVFKRLRCTVTPKVEWIKLNPFRCYTIVYFVYCFRAILFKRLPNLPFAINQRKCIRLSVLWNQIKIYANLGIQCTGTESFQLAAVPAEMAPPPLTAHFLPRLSRRSSEDLYLEMLYTNYNIEITDST